MVLSFIFSKFTPRIGREINRTQRHKPERETKKKKITTELKVPNEQYILAKLILLKY